MSEKNNIYIFERKEIIFVIIIVVLVSITSFFFGLTVGSEYSRWKAGYTKSDVDVLNTKGSQVDFTSVEEEKVEKFIKKDEGESGEPRDINKELVESLNKKIINEFSNENKKFNEGADSQQNMKREDDQSQMMNQKQEVKKDIMKIDVPSAIAQQEASISDSEVTGKDDFSGKYTIQLASYPTLKEAKEFAEGFKVLGYSPIINEAEIPGKGNWFRVSLGIFDSIAEAKEYILKNKTLFAERDYVFLQFD